MAATLVHDAMEGRSAEIKTEPKYVRLVYLYKAFFIVMNIVHGVQHYIVPIIFTLIEKVYLLVQQH